MTPEELARVKIDKQLNDAGWDIVSRMDYMPNTASAVKEALMQGSKESDYLLFVEDKAIAVVEAKKEENPLGDDVAIQAEHYAVTPQNWYGLWFNDQIPLVYLANGKKIYFKNMLVPDSEYEEIPAMHTPKQMLKIIGKKSEYGALPRIEKKGLRDCQYNAEVSLEESFKNGKKKALAVLATGSGKTYLACLASYRLLNYTPVKRILFLVDRNNLARQTESEFSLFDRTEKQQPLSSLYQINRLKKSEDISGDVVISTIQKLFAVLTGQAITDDDEDKEDEMSFNRDNEKNVKAVELGDDLKLPSDYFQFIIVDECHRSIYGKWKAVLEYFKDAKVLGLTATPTPEAYSFFNNNVIEKYTYDDSVVDGVNVPSRVFRIKTETSIHGGTIHEGETITEKTKVTGKTTEYVATERIDYTAKQLDRSVINKNQIETVLTAYRDSIYTKLYPERTEDWRYIPKTLIFAKDDNHATQIVKSVKEVFGEKFEGEIPDKYVQKITYSAGDSNALIRDFRVEKEFRIAVTVTLVATGTDVRPLEVVFFMNDVKSDVLYTQMKGRGCRVITDDKLKEVTPNATTKECFYIVDATGVTESDHTMPKPSDPQQKRPTLEQVLERLSHNEISDDNLKYLRDYCSTVHKRYENNALFGRHLDSFITSFEFAPRTLANIINDALAKGELPPFLSASEDNSERKQLISMLILNLAARKKLLELQKGYYAYSPENTDTVISAEFSKESARSFIETFEKYINDNKDSVEALRIIYNSENTVITYSMLCDLQDKLLAESKTFTPYQIWSNYKILDSQGAVSQLDTKQNVNALTNLIQIVRYAYRKNTVLTSLFSGYTQRFNLYCGQAQRELTNEQKEVMRKIAEYVVNDGAFTLMELNQFAPDLWKTAMIGFGYKAAVLTAEMQQLSKFILKVA
jgi:type I restriction enzyme R subunit